MNEQTAPPNSHPQLVSPHASTSLAQKLSIFLGRLFNGRLNRYGYLLGAFSLYVVLWFVGGSMFGGLGLIITPVTALYVTLFLLFPVILVFVNSLTVRRLHDLNRSGNWVLFFLPAQIVFMLVMILGFITSVSIDQVANTLPPAVNRLLSISLLLAQILGLFLLFWPGTKKDNTYGFPTRGTVQKEIFGFAPPQHADSKLRVGFISSQGLSKFISISLKILLGLILFFATFVGSILLIALFRRAF